MSSQNDPLFDLATMRRYAAPGQCLEERASRERGTIGVIGVDHTTNEPVALTAMHVIPAVTEYPSPLHPDVITLEAPCAGGQGTILGQLVRGTMRGVDAAAIRIVDQAPSNYLEGIGSIEFWRAIDPLRDENAMVRMRGAMSREVAFGRIVVPSLDVPSWNLTNALLVEIQAQPGDSGAPLVDSDGRLIGMLVGGNSTRQLFCPMELVFQALDCTLY